MLNNGGGGESVGDGVGGGGEDGGGVDGGGVGIRGNPCLIN